jgi:hypothetical protein
MKTLWKVFSLEERNIIIDAWLGIDGINKEEEMIVFRQHYGNFNNEFEAIEFIKDWSKDLTKNQPEHGFEIVKTISF